MTLYIFSLFGTNCYDAYMLISHQSENPCEYENLWKFKIRYKLVENVAIGQDKHDALRNACEILMHPCKSLRIFNKPCDSFTNNLPKLLRISCECYTLLRMPTQTLRMPANDLTNKTTTIKARACQFCFSVTFSLASIESSCIILYLFEKDTYL